MKCTDQIKMVLLVDDDTTITFLTKLALEELTDWHVEVAASGQEALDKVKLSVPDLILLDAMMPGLDGRETFRRLKAMESMAGTHIIFLTAKVQSDELEQFIALGAAGVITKPFDPITLVDTIEQVISRPAAREKAICDAPA